LKTHILNSFCQSELGNTAFRNLNTIDPLTCPSQEDFSTLIPKPDLHHSRSYWERIREAGGLLGNTVSEEG